jgi:hypothetical protein
MRLVAIMPMILMLMIAGIMTVLAIKKFRL